MRANGQLLACVAASAHSPARSPPAKPLHPPAYYPIDAAVRRGWSGAGTDAASYRLQHHVPDRRHPAHRHREEERDHDDRLCSRRPAIASVSGEAENPQIIGLIGADGLVANIPTPIPLTNEMRGCIETKPERIFRLAGPCVQSKCANWENQACGLIGRMRQELDRLQIATKSVEKLPRCGIRVACRWWRQRGADACRVCPHVIYNPSP
jgi:hypothetical protein